MSGPSERTPLLSGVAKPVGSPNADADESSHVSINTRRALVGLAVLCSYLATFDSTVVATCIPRISSELHESQNGAWIGTSYLWLSITCTPLYGRLSDILGRRQAFMQALTLFLLGTIGCGLAQNMKQLTFARALAGTGGGGMPTVISIIVADLFPLRERGLAQSLFFFGVAAGFGTGGPIGGFVTEQWGWRAAFLIQVPLVAVLWAIGLVILPRSKPNTDHWQTKLSQIDFLGSFMLFLSIGGFLFSLSFKVNSEYEWSNYRVVIPTGLFFVFLGIFVIVELFVAERPVLPLYLLQKRAGLCTGIIACMMAIVNFTMTYTLPVFFETVLNKSPSEAGAHLLPNSAAMCIGSPLAGYLLKRTGRHKWWTTLFSFGPVLSMFLLTRLNEHSGFFLQWLSVLPMGFGFAALLTTTLVAMMSACGRKEIAIASGFVFLWRGLGQVLGVGVSQGLLQGALTAELHSVFKGDTDLVERIRHSTELINHLPPEQEWLARQAFKHSLQKVFWFAFGGAVICLLASLPMQDNSLEDNPAPNAPVKVASRDGEDTQV